MRGPSRQRVQTILDAGQIKTKRRLFITATPRYYTSRLRREAGVLDVDVASMDDEAVFGPVLHRLSFWEGIERDLLSDYQVVVVGVDDDTYRSYAERGELVTRDGKKITDARTLADRPRQELAQVQAAPRLLLPRTGQGGARVQR